MATTKRQKAVNRAPDKARGRPTHVVRLRQDVWAQVARVQAEHNAALPTASDAVDYLLRYALARKAALARDNARREASK